jgi:hypothetical protein
MSARTAAAVPWALAGGSSGPIRSAPVPCIAVVTARGRNRDTRDTLSH